MSKAQSAFCRVHNAPLVPHGNSEIKIASDLTLFGDGVEPREPVDNLLGVVAFDDERMVARVFQVLDGTASIGRLEDRLSLRWAVRDIIDALATNMRAVGTGSLAAVLEQPLFQRKSLQGSNYLQMDWWSDVDAATRLLYVRLALAILADPGDPVRNPKTSPLGPHWLTLRYRHAKIQGWQGVFTHAAPDLLFLLVMELADDHPPIVPKPVLTTKRRRLISRHSFRTPHVQVKLGEGSRFGRGPDNQRFSDSAKRGSKPGSDS